MSCLFLWLGLKIRCCSWLHHFTGWYILGCIGGAWTLLNCSAEAFGWWKERLLQRLQPTSFWTQVCSASKPTPEHGFPCNGQADCWFWALERAGHAVGMPPRFMEHCNGFWVNFYLSKWPQLSMRRGTEKWCLVLVSLLKAGWFEVARLTFSSWQQIL